MSDKIERGQVTGRYAGPITRLAAFAVDGVFIAALYGLLLNILDFTLRIVLNVDLESEDNGSWWAVGIFVVWAFLYYAISWTITGRSIGKWLVGLRILERDGSPLKPGPALVRTIMYPISLMTFGLAYIGLFIGRERRAFHDVVAGSVVVYDWGDRAAEIPAPLTEYLARQDVIELPAADDVDTTAETS